MTTKDSIDNIVVAGALTFPLWAQNLVLWLQLLVAFGGMLYIGVNLYWKWLLVREVRARIREHEKENVHVEAGTTPPEGDQE